MNQVLSKIASGWRGMTGTAAGATAALGMLVAACALVAMAAPRASAQLQTDALRQLIARAPVTSKIIVASDPYDEVDDGPGT